MEIKFHCHNCGAKVKADTELGGDHALCPACQESVTVPTVSLETGAEIGGYEIKQRLGSGAMGEVFLAKQPGMERDVALKVLSENLTDDSEYVGRFTKEVQVLGNLAHPNIVSAFEAGKDGGHHYLAMQYVSGKTLEDILDDEEKLPEKRSLKLIYKMAKALKYAWDEQQLMHRDVKPGNIMIDDKGEPHLMDLGISKQMGDEQTGLTLTGFVVGTPGYMSPEQARGVKDLDCRTDIYALGATLYHMVTGRLPYDGESSVEVMTRVVQEAYPPARDVNPEISTGTSKLIDHMMAQNPADRYRNWDHMLADMRRLLKGKPLEQWNPKHCLEEPKTSRSLAPVIMMAAGLLLLLVVLFVGLWLLHGGGT